jgi:hypothetical protein
LVKSAVIVGIAARIPDRTTAYYQTAVKRRDAPGKKIQDLAVRGEGGASRERVVAVFLPAV